MDVFVCRVIWYLMTLLSLFGLSKSLKLLWPPGDSSSQFLRDGAVSATTFYAVRYSDIFSSPLLPPLSTRSLVQSWRDFLRFCSRYLPWAGVAFGMPSYYEQLTNKKFGLSMSLFTISLFTGGIGLIQLSGKFRMEMGHALSTLFLGWLFCLIGMLWFLCVPQMLLSFGLVSYNLSDEEDSDTFSASRLPT